jgi:hypothetical protein
VLICILVAKAFMDQMVSEQVDRWMLTRAKLKRGEGKLASYKPEIQK